MDSFQSPTLKVKQLQAEFETWLRRYIPLPEDVRVLATAWFGVMQKCCNYVDALLCACCDRLLPIAGDAGLAIVNKSAGGKPIDRLTLGQQVQILEALDNIVSSSLRDRFPNVVTHSRVLGKAGVGMLHELSRMRNDFAHRRWKNGDSLVATFLTTASAFCSSQLVAVAIALEDDS